MSKVDDFRGILEDVLGKDMAGNVLEKVDSLLCLFLEEYRRGQVYG